MALFEKDGHLDPRKDPSMWNPALAVKSYVRADAGNAESDEYIRPTPVLTITVMYMLKHHVSRYHALRSMPNPDDDAPHAGWYEFIMWRFRQVRKDLSMQGLLEEKASVPVIRIIERMLRFFIIAVHHCSDAQSADQSGFQGQSTFLYWTLRILNLHFPHSVCFYFLFLCLCPSLALFLSLSLALLIFFFSAAVWASIYMLTCTQR